MTNGRPLAVLLALALSSAAPSTHADETAAAAERLFQEARALTEAGRYAEACPKLAESQRLEPAIGTLFNLADCYEHIGRVASAHARFTEVAYIARAAGKFEREKSARERADALASKLPRVVATFASKAPGEITFLDDIPFPFGSEGDPVDPGEHRVFARAAGHISWSTTFVARIGESVALPIPALESETRERASATPPAGRDRTLSFVVGGVGIVGVGVGAAFGAIALSQRGTGERACPKDLYAFRCPTSEGADAWNAAHTAGTISTVGFVVGGAALAAATVLWFTAGPARARVSATSAGVLVDGSF